MPITRSPQNKASKNTEKPKSSSFEDFEEYTDPVEVDWSQFEEVKVLPKSLVKRGGFVDTGLLSGALPTIGGLLGRAGAVGVGSATGGLGIPLASGLPVAGASIGKAAENAIRESVGLDQRRNLMQGLNSALGQGVIDAFLTRASSGIPMLAKSISQSKPYGMAANVLKEGLDSLPFGAGKFLNAVPEARHRVAQEVYKREVLPKFEMAKEAAKETFGGLGFYEKGTIGGKIVDIASKQKDKIIENVAKAKAPLVQRWGKSVATSVEPLRKEIVSALNELRVLDDLGNVDQQAIANIQEKSMKGTAQKLSNFLEQIKANPTVKQLDSIFEQTRSLAKFDQNDRSGSYKLFGKVQKSAQNALYDSIESLGKRDAPKAIKTLKNANKAFSETIEFVEDLVSGGLIDEPSKSASKVMGFGPNRILQTINKIPALKEPIRDAISLKFVKSKSSAGTIKTLLNDYGKDSIDALYGNGTFDRFNRALSVLESKAPKEPLFAYGGLVMNKIIKSSEKIEKVSPAQFYLYLKSVETAAKQFSRRITSRQEIESEE